MKTYPIYSSPFANRAGMATFKHLGFALCMLTLWFWVTAIRAQMMAPAAHYEGRWELQANGDVKVTRTFKLPMQLYTLWKVKDVHMLEARNFAGARSSVEVAAQKADWDDLNQTLTMTMTVLGLGQNKVDHWEAKILPYLEFSNLDENQKIAYLHFSSQGDLGRIEGQDLIVFPTSCTKPSWDSSKKMVTYVMPPYRAAGIGGGSSLKSIWWISSVVCLIAGIGLWVVSSKITPSPRSKPEGQLSV